MKLEDIQKLWEDDCNIDKSNLDVESLKIPQLHSKYYKIYIQERSILKKLESELAVLRLAKHEFFTLGPTTETAEKGWQLPPKGKVIKSEVENYIIADNDIINLNLKIFLQKEKVDFVESIIKTLNNRTFSIRAAIDWIKFINGNN